MQREDEKLLRLKQQRSKEAIDLAMQGRWQEAAAANKEIVENSPEDVDAWNRLGRAYMELGDYTKSRQAYKHSVELDPYNAIANRNLRRLDDLKGSAAGEVDSEKVEPHSFIEEIGKAGVVSLYDLASKVDRARTVAGDKVRLKLEGAGLIVEGSRGEYLGRIDPRHGQRLTRLMKGGNRYTAVVVRATADMMSVIIREVYQDPSQVGKLSFPPKGLEEVRPYVSDRVFNADSEYEEDPEEESGYTIIGGDEIEVLPKEAAADDDESGSDED